jgi:rhamnosyltransferase
MKKPVIATILYNPDNSTYKRIKSVLNYGYEVYLFDNSPDLNSKLFLEENRNNLRYFTYDKNIGIGPALRLICSTAFFDGNESLLYFDQDTIFNEETLNFILDYLNESSEDINSSKKEKILSVTFRDAALDRKNGIIQKMSIGKYLVNIVDFTISSGTLFSLENLKKIGWHDDSYKVDGVDYSICISAEAKGLIIAEIFDTPYLDHETKQGNVNFRFLFKTYSGRRYSMFRIKDYICSSLRLTARSIRINKRLTRRLLKMLIYYLFIQLVIRVSK